MNILFIADPNSIHDVRWINFFSEKEEFSCYILPRRSHYRKTHVGATSLNARASVLPPLSDPSTIRPWRNFLQVIKIKNAIKRYGIELVHVMYAEPNALWANGKWLLGIPFVLTTRGTDVLRTIPEFYAKTDPLSIAIAFQYTRALRNFDQITCTSKEQINALTALGINQSKVIIRTGVDFETIDGLDDLCDPLKLDKPFIFMPRRMKPIYNHGFTMGAISLLEQ